MQIPGHFLKDETGATMIEYGIIIMLISVTAIGAMTAVGGQLKTWFTDVHDDIATC